MKINCDILENVLGIERLDAKYTDLAKLTARTLRMARVEASRPKTRETK